MFVGGSKFDISDLTNGQYSEGFNGCISSLSFQKFKLPGQSGPQKIGMVGIGFNDVQVFSTDSLHNIQLHSCEVTLVYPFRKEVMYKNVIRTISHLLAHFRC